MAEFADWNVCFIFGQHGDAVYEKKGLARFYFLSYESLNKKLQLFDLNTMQPSMSAWGEPDYDLVLLKHEIFGQNCKYGYRCFQELDISGLFHCIIYGYFVFFFLSLGVATGTTGWESSAAGFVLRRLRTSWRSSSRVNGCSSCSSSSPIMSRDSVLL